MNAEKKILMQIVESDLYYNSEYDGRMYSYCRYCDSGQGSQHGDSCVYIQAFDVLEQEIYEKEKQKLINTLNESFNKKARESQSLFKRVLREKLNRISAVYVVCERCGKNVNQKGLEPHQKSMSCKEKSAKNNSENTKRKCLHCETSIDHMHINAKFCSNKGVGNCKDKYYNKLYKR